MRNSKKVTLMISAGVVGLGMVTGAQAQTAQSILNGNTLVTVNTSAPSTVLSSVQIAGIAPGTTIAGIDYRPGTGRMLYAISNVGQIYAVNARTGQAFAIGTPPLPTISSVGFDFNPTVDRLRIVTQNRQDVRANPDTGALAATDGTLAYAPSDANATAIPTVAGAAYTNSVRGATTTTLYVLDTRGGLAPVRLATQGNAATGASPNSGQLFTVGSTGVASTGAVGFDISQSGQAFATLTNPTTLKTSLYSVNLQTGTATLIGVFGANLQYEGLALALPSFASMGATTNQAVVGAAIDQFGGMPSGDTLALIDGIDGVSGTPGAQSAALQSLSPAAYSNLTELSLNAVEVSETNVLRYARDLRGNATMPDGTTATLDEAGKVGAWLLGGARFGKYEAAVDRPKTTSDEVHIVGGLDYRFAPAVAIGTFGGYSDTNARLTPGAEQSKLKSWFAGGYGTAAVGPAYVDLWGSYTDLDWRLHRFINFGGFTGSPAGQTGGRVWAGGASTGLSFSVAMLELEPFAAVRYADIKINGFGETGGSAAALAIGQMDRTSVRSNVGARAGAKFEIGSAIVRPQIRGSWYHEFKDDPQQLTAAFLNPGLSTTAFSFTTTPLSADYFNTGASLNIAGSGPLSMVADYDAQFDGEREYHSFTIGARLAF